MKHYTYNRDGAVIRVTELTPTQFSVVVTRPGDLEGTQHTITCFDEVTDQEHLIRRSLFEDRAARTMPPLRTGTITCTECNGYGKRELHSVFGIIPDMVTCLACDHGRKEVIVIMLPISQGELHAQTV